jgi:hypothetical protein
MQPILTAALLSCAIAASAEARGAQVPAGRSLPTLGNARVFVADACDGKPRDDNAGPLRLPAPDDARAARSVCPVQSIDVVESP